MATGTVDGKPSISKKLNLGWLGRLLHSTIGRKMIMAVTGLGLCGFLVAHLAGNLFVFQGKAALDGYAHKLHEQEWLPLAEAGLFLMFLVHIYLAISLTIENRNARQTSYAVKESKRQDRIFSPAPSSWMFISGAVVLGFLILHLIDMKFTARPDIAYATEEGQSFYNTVAVLSNPISQIVYIIGTIVLGFHLSHGFSSAFQSLGLNHPKYMPTIKVIGIVFAFVISAGFCSLPLLVPRTPAILKEWNEARTGLVDVAPSADTPHAP